MMSFATFDHATEIRFAHNGGPAERQGASTRLTLQLAWQADLTPPTKQHRQFVAKRCPAEFGQNAGTAERLAVVESCMARFNKGIAIDRNNLERLQNESEAYILENAGGMPPYVIDKYGTINSQRLAEKLPNSVKADWPKDNNGLLLTDSGSLEQQGNAHSRALLAAKRQQRDWALRNLPVDQDGRHRSYPNPYGTITGRENPKGPSFARLSRNQRRVLVPDEDHVLATIDFQQQEPAIAMCFARVDELLQAYENGDFYCYVATQIPGDFCRKRAKQLVIAFLYGATPNTLTRKLDMTPAFAEECITALKRFFSVYRKWSNQYLQNAYRTCEVTSLDWRMTVHPGTRTATLRNWPIQAAGADILRRACLKLAEADIPVVGCLHDSVMLEIPLAGYDLAIRRAQLLMADASAEVLDGFRLKSTVDNIDFPSGITAGGFAHG